MSLRKLGGGSSNLDQSFVLTGTVLFKNQGVSSNGEDWYMVKIGGFTFFQPELHAEVQVGQRVELHGNYVQDRYSKKSGGYTPVFEFTGYLLLDDAPLPTIDPVPGIPRVNGVSNGVKLEKGAPG